MKRLVQTNSLVIFIITTLPFALATVTGYAYSFELVGFFLTAYWILSAGKYGAVVLGKENTGSFILFSIANRLLFVFYTTSFLLHRYYHTLPRRPVMDVLLWISSGVFLLSVLTTVLFSARMLAMAEGKHGPAPVALNTLLFILFPIGAWLLQPKIKNFIWLPMCNWDGEVLGNG